MGNLYLHCGLPKTGTTSIQKYAAAHRDALRQAGFDYPEMCIGKEGNAHHNIAREILGDKQFVPQNGTIADLLQYISSNRHGANLLLSSEGLTHCLLRSTGRGKLFEFLARVQKVRPPLFIVYTFREFYRISESSYLDRLRKGQRHDCRNPFDRSRTTNWLRNLAHGLTAVGAIVGRDHLLVCDVAGQNSVTGIATTIGLQLTDRVDNEQKFNRRLGLKRAALIYRVLFPTAGSISGGLSKDRLAQIRKRILAMPDLPGESYNYRLLSNRNANEIQRRARNLLPSYLVSRLNKSIATDVEPYETVDLNAIDFTVEDLAAVRFVMPSRLASELPWLNSAVMV